MPTGDLNPWLAAAIGTVFGLLVTVVTRVIAWLVARLTKCEQDKQALIDASVTTVTAKNEELRARIAKAEAEAERWRRKVAREGGS